MQYMNTKLKNYMSLSVADVKIRDGFWSRYVNMISDFSIPFLWDALNDNIPGAEVSHAIENYRIAAGEKPGNFYGAVFQDSDVTKWLEGAALCLMHQPDPALEAQLDEVVEIIARAQQPDGYLDTYYIIQAPDQRWKNLQEGHELYCAGHMFEAAVAYFKATGKRRLLDIACRLADLIADTFGEDEGQLHGYAGHPEIELALVKLYEVTGNERYLHTAGYFIDQRGLDPYYFALEAARRGNRGIYAELPNYGRDYAQAHRPVREQDEARGHAVRAMYLYSGMADVALSTGDRSLLDALTKIWRNIVDQKLYVTGAVGSSEYGEAFSENYDLPSDRAYAETCASIGLMMFAQRMLNWELDSEYADVMELALYNVVLGSMACDGRSFFYVNPLEVYPELCGRRDMRHVLPERQKWFACSCCAPNAIRTVLSVGAYAYSKSDSALNVHLYVGGELNMEFGGEQVRIFVRSSYLIDGRVHYTLHMDRPVHFALNLRIPSWSTRTDIRLNGESLSLATTNRGYLTIERSFMDGDEIIVAIDMDVHFLRGNPHVRATAGKVAVRRGPLIYCAESVDNGPDLHLLRIDTHAGAVAVYKPEMLNGVCTIRMSGERLYAKVEKGLYGQDCEIEHKHTEVLLIPYYVWGNRGVNEMRVWLEE